jgi:hypothetical protein
MRIEDDAEPSFEPDPQAAARTSNTNAKTILQYLMVRNPAPLLEPSPIGGGEYHRPPCNKLRGIAG